jgi:hypothetical protein
MNKLKLILILLIAISYSSCSSDEDTETVSKNTNGFNFKDDFFSLNQAYITDENIINNTPSNITVVLSNVDVFNPTSKSGVNYFRFEFKATSIVAGIITPVLKYSLRENTNLNDFLITDGNTVLGHNDARIRNRAVSSFIRIESISANEIDLNFEFTREDGEMVKGSYKGTYTRQD